MKAELAPTRTPAAQTQRDATQARPGADPARPAPQLTGLAQMVAQSPRMAAERTRIAQLFGDRQTTDRSAPATVQLEDSGSAPKANRTGLPDNLKAGVESLSGHAMDDVRVHRNSSRPGELGALAYAQGRDIHVAPGQERHLPHEAWHLVQQAQGRVKPTMQMQAGVPVNDDPGLEHEADVMGARALSASPRADDETVAQARPRERDGAGVMQPVWVNAGGAALDEQSRAMVLKDPLAALAEIGNKLGLGEAATALRYRIAAVYESGNTELLQSANQNLALALNDNQHWPIDRLLGEAMNHLNLPDDTMADPEHSEDAGGGNPEEDLEKGDLALSEIDGDEQKQIAQALVERNPGLFQQFQELAQRHKVEASPHLFLVWYNQGVLTRSQFKNLGSGPMQMARTPGALSYQAGYNSSLHGAFKDVTYKLDGYGSIDFGSVHKRKVWKNPMKAGSEVQLNKGSGKNNYGITLNGTKIKIPGASRGQHFSMANRIMKNGFGNSSPTNWTWHHLTAPYKMVLVDRTVHAKHGHNGGVYVWK